MACALAAMHSWRVVPLTGTPYNNGVNDLGTLMTLIDSAHEASMTSWWERVLRRNPTMIQESTGLWHKEYILRRGKKAIEHLLPAKITARKLVPIVANEIQIYRLYEDRLADVLQEFADEIKEGGEDAYRLRSMFQVMMAVMSCMRMSLTHPLLPASGRELTKRFSPSRNKSLSPYDCPIKCVCCQEGLRPSIPLKTKQEWNNECSMAAPNSTSSGATSNPDKMEEGENYKDDTEEALQKDCRPVFEIPKSVCNAKPPVVHYAHTDCIEELKAEQARTGATITCPRCLDFQNRVKPTCTQSSSTKYYCKNVLPEFPNGFVGSPKLDAAVEWALAVPKSDKMLIVSFFKGSLDLMEAILVLDLEWKCARFDGDVSTQTKNEELRRFKTDPSCRVLLMTVQSGGVGLNITEGNHIAFLDRWFNPFVHQQAEDRCHRLGQTKKVTIQYFDCAATIDEVMNAINKVKQQNSAILLADGVELGTSGGNVSYTELSGLVRRLLALIQNHRKAFLRDTSNENLPIPPIPDTVMEGCVNRHREGKAACQAHVENRDRGKMERNSASHHASVSVSASISVSIAVSVTASSQSTVVPETQSSGAMYNH